jgi:hypothetical protein
MTACDAKRRDPPMIGQHHGRHRLEKPHASRRAVAARVQTAAAAAAADRERIQTHGKAPFEHFGIGQP